MDDVARLLVDQDGVISRKQVLETGLSAAHIVRAVRRREWAQVHPGVYVDHTGPLSWQQRAWAGVLFSWPAALSHESAVRAGDGPGRRHRDDSLIHVAIDRQRHVVAPDGIVLHRMLKFDGRVHWNLGPPRIRFDDAVLDVAADARTDLAAIAVLADACGARRTTARRLLVTLEGRGRIARRSWLESVLTDVAEGTCSVLEHGYLTRVERPHGLPSGRRQSTDVTCSGSVYRDVEYEGVALIVELDGRLFHESSEARARDLERDLDAAADRETIRLGFAQVFDRGCSTAFKLGTVLQRRGWDGAPTRCHLCGTSDEPGERINRRTR